jgi:hypothetical protein
MAGEGEQPQATGNRARARPGARLRPGHYGNTTYRMRPPLISYTFHILMLKMYEMN